jgi:YVTN family beta-propeller protein
MRRLLLPPLRSTLVSTVLSTLLGAALLAGCSEQAVTPPQIVIPGPGEAISYSKHIAPIFATSCATAGCHDAVSAQNGLVLGSWEKVMQGSSAVGAVVVPFAPRKSHLLQHISTDTTIAPMAEPRMPYGRDPLPREQILSIKRWIEEGAKNDAGEIALSGNRPRVLVTNQAEDLVAAIDIATRRVARYVSVGHRPDSTSAPEAPHNIVYSPDGRYFYVNLIASGEVEKYDAVTFAKLGTATVGLSPAQIAVTSDGSTLYVSNFDQTFQQRFISRIDAATMSGVTEIETGGYAPHGVALSKDERRLYTTNAGSDDITEIDAATGDILRIIPIVPDSPLPSGTKAKHEPYQGVLSADGRLFYVTCRASAQVRVVDLDAGRVIDSIGTGNRPLILDRTPNGAEIWVPNQGSESVSIINTSSRSVVATITGLKTQPHGVAFTADGATAFVSCENQTGGAQQHHPVVGSKAPGFVYVIDVATRSIVRTIEVGAFAAGIAIPH